MASNKHLRAALAVVFMDHMATAPALHRPEGADSYDDRAVRNTVQEAEACTARERVDRIISEDGSYANRHPEDIYISAPALAEVLEVSEETARRRLKFLDEQGILFQGAEGTRLYYELASDFCADTSESVPSEAQIIDTTRRVLNALEEE